MQFSRINGNVLHYQVIGHESGRPALVFSNSLGTDFRIWRDVIVQLAGDFTIVTYDKRGHGLSEAPKAPYSLDDHVDDLSGLLDLLGLKDALICGLSVGGMIAQGLYHKRPDLVRGLMLCDTAHKLGDDATWNGRIEAARLHGLRAMSASVMERWFTSDFHEHRKDELAGYATMLSRQSVEGYCGTMETVRDTDLTDKCGQIACPVMCVVGDQDIASSPELVESFAKMIPGAEFEVIAGSGHIPCVEQPEQLVNLIRRFAAEAPLGRTIQ